jgi:hypothetical protein
MVQQPTKGLGQGIIWINGAPDVAQDHFTFGDPLLQGKMLYVNVMTAIRRALGICHHNGSCIVLIELSSFQLTDRDLHEDSTEILCELGGTNSRDKFTFGGTEADGCHPLRSVCNGSSSEKKNAGSN